MKLPIATFINMATVVIGSLIGLWLQQLFPQNIEIIIFQAIGLGVLIIGISMALKVPEGYLLIFIFSLILGGVIGEAIGFKEILFELSEGVKSVFRIEEAAFSDGLITAFLLFCVGSITVVGAIEEGIKGKRELLLIKSTLDGITSIALAASYGIGVLFSIFPMLLFQGGITILAGWSKSFFTPTIIAQLSAVGGALIVGVGINMLQLGNIRLENLLPGLVVVVILTYANDRIRARLKNRSSNV